ncbi:MAG TPA: serine protease [Candidatus Acidoferrales bacterium]
MVRNLPLRTVFLLAIRLGTTATFVLVFVCFGTSTYAQIAAPKHESQFHHLFRPHRDVDNLQQRYADLKCGVVLIQVGPKLGTGFFISADGDMATASHVLGDRTFSRNPDGSIKVNIAVPSAFTITNSAGKVETISAHAIDVNPDAWVADVAFVKTGIKTPCWFSQADDQQSAPGQHLITLGYPGLSFQALTLYTGIMSARLTTTLPTVILDTGEPVKAPNEFIRVEMPISAGLSGAPVIDDENRVVGIVTNAGGWTADLDRLMLAYHGGAFATPPAPAPTQPNEITFNLNGMAVVAELAGLFHDFASPGYGDAVPMRYLKKPPQQNQPSASPAH